MKITTLDPFKNREVVAGELRGSVFTKKVGTKHFFRKYNGYAIQKDVIDDIKTKGCVTVKIISPSGLYTSLLAGWEAGETITGKHGTQIVLPITSMTLTQ
jgi:hypothetical protein